MADLPQPVLSQAQLYQRGLSTEGALSHGPYAIAIQYQLPQMLEPLEALYVADLIACAETEPSCRCTHVIASIQV